MLDLNPQLAKFRNNEEDHVPIIANTMILDTGMSFGLLPLGDLLSIVIKLKENYNLTCKPKLDEGRDVNRYECDCKNHKVEDLPSLRIFLLND